MKNWTKYMDLVKERPSLFTNEELEIITDETTIAEFEKNSGREIGIAYESPWRYMLVDLVRNPAGRLFAYERVVPVKTGGVAVLPVYENHVVLIREYRHAVQCWRWEMPRGFGIAGASAIQNAAKELYEETGIKDAKLTHLGQLNSDSGLTSDQVDLFLAEVKALSVSLLHKEETESIAQVRLFSLDEICKMIVDGEITDGFTMSAIGIWQLSKKT